jgi:hypothetical protein
MVMACGMLIGWQITGYNFDAEMDVEGQRIARGIEASFVPSDKCAPFSKPWNVGPWWMVFAVWNLLLLVPVLGGLQVRLRDMPSHYIIAYISLLCFGKNSMAMIMRGACTRKIIEIIRYLQLPHPFANFINRCIKFSRIS